MMPRAENAVATFSDVQDDHPSAAQSETISSVWLSANGSIRNFAGSMARRTGGRPQRAERKNGGVGEGSRMTPDGSVWPHAVWCDRSRTNAGQCGAVDNAFVDTEHDPGARERTAQRTRLVELHTSSRREPGQPEDLYSRSVHSRDP